jgi:steroid delta-isomerase-like uncharacterized protein
MIPAMLIVFLAATGCQAQEDASKTLGPVVQAYAEVWNSGDTPKLDAIVDAKFVRHASPTAQTYAANLDSLKKVITNFREMYPDFNVVLEEGVYAGNTGAVRWTFTGTNSGTMNPALSGKEVKLSGISFFHVADGKITEEWVFSDNMDIMTQLGFKVVPPAAEGEE